MPDLMVSPFDRFSEETKSSTSPEAGPVTAAVILPASGRAAMLHPRSRCGEARLIGLLQPARSAIIAVRWWFGLHGFRKERPGMAPDETEA